MFLYIKALHIIFVVTWFAGLFYIVRLFIYFAEASEKPEPEKTILEKQFALMQRRLWFGITWPSAVITFLIGLYMLHWTNSAYGGIPGWLWWKLSFVLGLFAYHFFCHRIFKQQQRRQVTFSSFQLRIWNEVATLFLVGIVFLVVLKSMLDMLWGLAGLVAFSFLLMAAIMVYRKLRGQKEKP